MIKRTMYFYDKKQAKIIDNLNNKLHRQRGVKVGDADDIISVYQSLPKIISAMDDVRRSVYNISLSDKAYRKVSANAKDIYMSLKALQNDIRKII